MEISVSEDFMSMEFCHVTQQMNTIGQTRLPVFNQPQVMATALTANLFFPYSKTLYIRMHDI